MTPTALLALCLAFVAVLLLLLAAAVIALARTPSRSDVNLWRNRTANWKARAETAEAEMRKAQQIQARHLSRQTFAVPLPQPPPAVKAETQTLVLTDLDAT